MLLGIDEIARKLPSVVFVATTNFIEAVDAAFLSRADLVMHFRLPDQPTIARILEAAIGELAVQWPALLPLAQDRVRIGELAATCNGWDGRRVRKLVLAALAQRLETARDPSLLTWQDFQSAARKNGGVEWTGGPALEARQMFPDVPPELMHDHGHGHLMPGDDYAVPNHDHAAPNHDHSLLTPGHDHSHPAPAHDHSHEGPGHGHTHTHQAPDHDHSHPATRHASEPDNHPHTDERRHASKAR